MSARPLVVDDQQLVARANGAWIAVVRDGSTARLSSRAGWDGFQFSVDGDHSIAWLNPSRSLAPFRMTKGSTALGRHVFSHPRPVLCTETTTYGLQTGPIWPLHLAQMGSDADVPPSRVASFALKRGKQCGFEHATDHDGGELGCPAILERTSCGGAPQDRSDAVTHRLVAGARRDRLLPRVAGANGWSGKHARCGFSCCR